MKNISEIYETIIDSDEEVAKRMNRKVDANPQKLNAFFKEFIVELYDAYNTGKCWTIREDGTIDVIDAKFNEMTITSNLPDYVKFNSIDPKIDITIQGVDSLQGLPDTFDGTMIIKECPGLKNFEGAPKKCAHLIIRNCYDISSFKGLPECKTLKIRYCGQVDIKNVTKYTKTRKQNITIIL